MGKYDKNNQSRQIRRETEEMIKKPKSTRLREEKEKAKKIKKKTSH